MPGRAKSFLWLVVALFFLGGILHWEEPLQEAVRPLLKRFEAQRSLKDMEGRKGEESELSEKELVGTYEGHVSGLHRAPFPHENLAPGSARDPSRELPPPPPLPQVSPESGREERREAFQLKESVDQVVLKDEAFEVGGKQHTIEEIQARLGGEKGGLPAVPAIKESDVAPFVRRSIVEPSNHGPSYYGVRVVRPYENVWSIHLLLLKEYLTRRHMIIPPTADQPYPDGRSSGIGCLLKFMESVVFVYNLNENRLEKDLNLIYPDSVVVFFKISDLFAALDQLQSEDLHWLHYTNNQLRLDRPEGTREILNRRNLLE